MPTLEKFSEDFDNLGRWRYPLVIAVILLTGIYWYVINNHWQVDTLGRHAAHFLIALVGAIITVGFLVDSFLDDTPKVPFHDQPHGTARFSETQDLKDECLIGENLVGEGIWLGLHGKAKKKIKSTDETNIVSSGERHIITVAPPRSGKGVSCIIPNLLTYKGSMIIIDPKRENLAVTKRQREKFLY